MPPVRAQPEGAHLGDDTKVPHHRTTHGSTAQWVRRTPDGVSAGGLQPAGGTKRLPLNNKWRRAMTPKPAAATLKLVSQWCDSQLEPPGSGERRGPYTSVIPQNDEVSHKCIGGYAVNAEAITENPQHGGDRTGGLQYEHRHGSNCLERIKGGQVMTQKSSAHAAETPAKEVPPARLHPCRGRAIRCCTDRTALKQ